MLQADEVWKHAWEAGPKDAAAVASMAANVHDSDWILQQCMSAVCADLDSMEALLMVCLLFTGNS